jgi:hypothetical protein
MASCRPPRAAERTIVKKPAASCCLVYMQEGMGSYWTYWPRWTRQSRIRMYSIRRFAMPAGEFSTSFNLYDYGIVDAVAHAVLPPAVTMCCMRWPAWSKIGSVLPCFHFISFHSLLLFFGYRVRQPVGFWTCSILPCFHFISLHSLSSNLDHHFKLSISRALPIPCIMILEFPASRMEVYPSKPRTSTSRLPTTSRHRFHDPEMCNF